MLEIAHSAEISGFLTISCKETVALCIQSLVVATIC